MYIDKEALFSNEQAITVDAASTNVIDTGATADVGPGEEIELFVKIVEEIDNLTSLKVSLQTSTTENFSSPIELVSQTLTDLTVGAQASICCVPHGAKRYLRLYFDVTKSGESNPSQGKVTAGITVDRDDNQPVAIA